MIKKEQAYCQLCDEDVDFNIVERKREATVRGVSFSYTFFEARCKKCGEQVYPVSVGKKNTISMFDEYKKSVGLLTSYEIKKIRKDNHLSQKALAKKIGCGEKNIARYENGGIQNKTYDILIRMIGKKILVEDNYFIVYQNDYSFQVIQVKPIHWDFNCKAINYSNDNNDILMEKKHGTNKTVFGII